MALSLQNPGGFISPTYGTTTVPVVGYVGTTVAEEYIVTVTSAISGPGGQSAIVVRAIMQEEVQMKVDSKWESFLQMITSSPIGNALELGAQSIFQKSLQNAALSRRIWRGTSPVSLTLSLRFEEEHNSSVEVMQAVEALQSMCLPGSNGGPGATSFSLLIPPGPSPFKNNIIPGINSELISVFVGKALYFANVIIDSVTVSHTTRVGTDGFFKAAKVAVVFSTYEIVTKNNLRSSSANDSGIYSTLAISNSQKNSAVAALQSAAAGITPNVAPASTTAIPNNLSLF